MFLDFKDYSLKLIICRSHLSNVLSCLMQKYNFKATKCMFKCAFSHRKVISKSTPKFLKPADLLFLLFRLNMIYYSCISDVVMLDNS